MDKIGQFLERGFFGGIVLAAAFAGAVYWHRPGKRGGLYTLLVRLDFDVKGTAEHFTVTGADGHSYEFSYSFYMPFFEITGFRAPWDTDGYCLLFCVYLSADTP